MGSHFASGMGHNVLQLGTAEPGSTKAGDTLALPGWQQPGLIAPINTERLDDKGGEVSLTIESGYDGLRSWKRNVRWDADSMKIDDDVSLAQEKTNTVLFRWHLGTNDDVDVKGEGGKWLVTWGDAAITLHASSGIDVSQMKLPDNTINAVSEEYLKDGRHTCIMVTSASPVSAFSLSTKVSQKSN
jgi:hypothetical protein